MQSILAAANQAFQNGETSAAMAGYVNALLQMPELGKTIAGNILRTREKYLKSRNKEESLKVVVCGWELAHNAAGRAHTLAEIYREITSDVEIVGSIFPRWGMEIWEPIRETTIPIDTFLAEPSRFIEQALTLVVAHPADVVHLSKPRAPNIFFGIFYKLLWGSKIIVDIDEEELVFVKAESPVTVVDYLEQYQELPPLEQLTDNHWTRIAAGLAGEFDAITVSNAALRSRYGGTVIGHARDPRTLKPSRELRQTSRIALGIQPHQKVVIFLGTPRPHKGLLDVAKAIHDLRREDIIFVIAGSFSDKHIALKSSLQAITGVQYIFIENQPISSIANTLAVADCCVLLQDTSNPCSNYQIPAKLSDALAMGLNVLCTETNAIKEVIDAGAVVATKKDKISENLSLILDNPNLIENKKKIKYFYENMTIKSNASRVMKIIKEINSKPELSDQLMKVCNSINEISIII